MVVIINTPILPTSITTQQSLPLLIAASTRLRNFRFITGVRIQQKELSIDKRHAEENWYRERKPWTFSRFLQPVLCGPHGFHSGGQREQVCCKLGHVCAEE